MFCDNLAINEMNPGMAGFLVAKKRMVELNGGMQQGIVYLLGAGPGDPGLITVRGRELVGMAEVLVYDALSSAEMLNWAPAACERIFVGKRASRHALPQEEINALLVRLGRAGKKVVRLKGGDPYVFGRGGEEADALHEAGIPFEVVPGVTSAIAGPAYAGIPVTHREVNHAVTFLTGHAPCVGALETGTRSASTGKRRHSIARKQAFGVEVVLIEAAIVDLAFDHAGQVSRAYAHRQGLNHRRLQLRGVGSRQFDGHVVGNGLIQIVVVDGLQRRHIQLRINGAIAKRLEGLVQRLLHVGLEFGHRRLVDFLIAELFIVYFAVLDIAVVLVIARVALVHVLLPLSFTNWNCPHPLLE